MCFTWLAKKKNSLERNRKILTVVDTTLLPELQFLSLGLLSLFVSSSTILSALKTQP